ncbi:MAG: phosphoribosylglycinamide synthetase [Rhodocyclales bacterium]|nr:phosphoribosylglycinamide synthetase [Rhodocyclales bacterium]
MRCLGIGEYCDLGDMYYRLAAAGHEVRVFVEHPDAQDIFGGMLQFTHDWRNELDWIREAGQDGIVLFESSLKGTCQDDLRREGYQVIGGSAFGDRIEGDREFGQQVLHRLGLPIAASHGFTDFDAAMDFVRDTRRRYVFKSNGADSARTRNYIGELEDGRDMIALLIEHRDHWHESAQPDFVLMEHIEGVEVGVGAYFNGREFLQPACLDFEHKRLFNGNLGELTGEMGTVVTYRGAERIFDATLARMVSQLGASGYCGYINLNLIANEHGLWPLEFTSRFGYPGFAICEALHTEPWDAIFRKMLRQSEMRQVATRTGFATGVVLTVPPFPYRYGYEELSKGSPIMFRAGMTEADRAALHFAEVAMRESRLVTSGMTGYVGVATGVGESLADASACAYELARKVVVPNLRYRTDIGERVIKHDLARLQALGYYAV